MCRVISPQYDWSDVALRKNCCCYNIGICCSAENCAKYRRAFRETRSKQNKMLGLRSHIDTREPGHIEDVGVCPFLLDRKYI